MQMPSITIELQMLASMHDSHEEIGTLLSTHAHNFALKLHKYVRITVLAKAL